jgi:hypothetical protein
MTNIIQFPTKIKPTNETNKMNIPATLHKLAEIVLSEGITGDSIEVTIRTTGEDKEVVFKASLPTE